MIFFNNLSIGTKFLCSSLSRTGTGLTSNVYQTASSVNEIAASIQSMKEQIHNQAEEVQKTGSRSILAEEEPVKRQGLKLEQSAEINSGMNEAATGTELISGAANRVNGISDENKQNIDTLITEIAKFKE